MYLSYEKHLRIARKQSRAVDDSPHWIALYGALGSRYRTRGVSPPEPELWAELAPFMSMAPESLAVQALAEYVVYQELPNDAKQDWLKWVIEREIAATRDEDRDVFVAARGLRLFWHRLLAEPPRQLSASAVRSAGESGSDDGRIDQPSSSELVRNPSALDVLSPVARGEVQPIEGETDIDRLAARGNAGAQYALGVQWAHGPVWVEEDCVEAVKWFKSVST